MVENAGYVGKLNKFLYSYTLTYVVGFWLKTAFNAEFYYVLCIFEILIKLTL